MHAATTPNNAPLFPLNNIPAFFDFHTASHSFRIPGPLHEQQHTYHHLSGVQTVFNWMSHPSKWLLALGACLTLCPTLHAEGLHASPSSACAQIVRPIDDVVIVSFPIQMSLSEGFVFGGLSVSDFYNKNGDAIVPVVPDWSNVFHGYFGTDVFFWLAIDENTPLGRYDCSSPTSDQQPYFSAYAYNPMTFEESTVYVPLSLEILANPAAAPEPASALTLSLGMIAAAGLFARRRLHRPA
jgi:hypothetical protein